MNRARDHEAIELGFSPVRAQWPALVGMATLVASGLGGVLACVGSFYFFVLESDSPLAGLVLTGSFVALVTWSAAGVFNPLWEIARGAPAFERPRLSATGDGVALDAQGERRHRWSEIDGFEVGRVVADDDCGSSVGAVMRLRTGQRVELPALEMNSLRSQPNRQLAAISERVDTLNRLLDERAARGSR